ncbi:hypothetical protein C9374_000618 [Naegleria lovaniensis]|uniref:Non-structural maintenance of chromosomes element 4 n=1 Tax=Naegleria lovaniensis TaxID=51637 RepID=A0AA88GYQ5_NAELO|nr:uncharacterized protein C9374_000618 [Naegleria lovaniensis]KAG2388454.1 hypothetical protein C9374_000618 [Naegleria lovaniensis]
MLQNRKERVEESDSEEYESEEVEQQEEEDEETVKKRDPSFRRQLRANYIDLISRTSEKAEEICEPGSHELLHILGKGDKYQEDIYHAREGALDAAWFAQSTKCGLEQATRLNFGKEWDPIELITKLSSKYPSSNQSNVITSAELEFIPIELDWNKIGESVSGLFRRTPTITFMNGPIKVERKEKKRKERPKKSKDDIVEEKEAEEMTDVTKQDATTKEVQNLYKKLKSQTKKRKKEHTDEHLSVLEVLVDPNSFTKTIENFFYFSFLVKEGKASFELHQNELQTCILRDDETNDSTRNQSVLSLNLNMYNQLVQQRAKALQQQSNGASSSPHAGNDRTAQEDGEEE